MLFAVNKVYIVEFEYQQQQSLYLLYHYIIRLLVRCPLLVEGISPLSYFSLVTQ